MWGLSSWLVTGFYHPAPGYLRTVKLSKANSHFKTLLIYIYKPFLKSVHKTGPHVNIKQHMIHTQTSNTFFWTVSPFNITCIKRAHKARDMQVSSTILIYYTRFKKIFLKNNFRKRLYKSLNAWTNISATRQKAAHTIHQLSNPSCSTGEKKILKKEGLTPNEKCLISFQEKSQELPSLEIQTGSLSRSVTLWAPLRALYHKSNQNN